jgi:ABC-type multidrug transport system ATPase subunit
MSLLELESVGKRYGRMGHRIVLCDVSLRVESGEVVVIWGMRRSGRSTLLRIAAGIESPDTGTVHFEGRDLRAHPGATLGDGIGYCRRTFAEREGAVLLDQITAGPIARGVPLTLAAKRARESLERVEIGSCARRRPEELDGNETVRAAIARALILSPRLLILDEPTIGVDLLARDGVLLLLHSLAHDGVAILATTGESPSLSGARALTLSEGELHGPPAVAERAKLVALSPTG